MNKQWVKSSYSGGSGGNCVEVADRDSRVLVRDTKQAGTGPMLRFTPVAWRRFAEQVKRSLASDSQSDCRGHSRVRECPPFAMHGIGHLVTSTLRQRGKQFIISPC